MATPTRKIQGPYETSTVEIPGEKSNGDWAKVLDSIDAGATTGHGWTGEWLRVGCKADLAPGTIYVYALYSTDRRGRELIGAYVSLVLPKDRKLCIASSTNAGWAQELRKEVREWLAKDTETRVRDGYAEKIARQSAFIPTVTDDAKRAKAQQVLDYYTAELAQFSAPVSDPKSLAIEQIRKLMADHGITQEEIFPERA